MWFDPFDNLVGAALVVWIGVGLVWFFGIAFFRGLPDWMSPEKRRAQRETDAARKDRARKRQEDGLDW
jgi:hypothetical protein